MRNAGTVVQVSVWFDWHRLRVLLQGIAKYADFKIYEDEGPNTTDVDASLQQLKDNDAKLKELNLNNIKVDTWDDLLERFANDAWSACCVGNLKDEKVPRCFADNVTSLCWMLSRFQFRFLCPRDSNKLTLMCLCGLFNSVVCEYVHEIMEDGSQLIECSSVYFGP